ncbi:hypothetical protein THAOC_35978, partial [Thalassiosira oceanica]
PGGQPVVLRGSFPGPWVEVRPDQVQRDDRRLRTSPGRAVRGLRDEAGGPRPPPLRAGGHPPQHGVHPAGPRRIRPRHQPRQEPEEADRAQPPRGLPRGARREREEDP